MAIFGRGYDRDYDNSFRQASRGFQGNWNRPDRGRFNPSGWDRDPDRDFGWGAHPRDFNRYDTGMQSRYDRGFRGRFGPDGRTAFSNRPGGGVFEYAHGNFRRYDRDFNAGSRYDRNFRGGDRSFRGGNPGFQGYDRSFRMGNRNFRGYDRNFLDSEFPMGYKPWAEREGYEPGGVFGHRDHPWY